MQLNVLDDIQIATPCAASWNDMTGDESVRHCDQCRLNVYNISEMTRDEAERLVFATEDRVCVRFYRRRDGTILTQDCPKGMEAVRRRLVGWWTTTAAALGFAVSIPGCIMGARPANQPTQGRVTTTTQPTHEEKTIMGDVKK